MISILLSFLKTKFPAIIWTAIIFILCTIPADDAAKIGTMNDKLNHAIAFAGFVFFWLFHTSMAKLIVIVGIFYGILIEVWQYILPESFHRGFELLDAVADAVGCIVGYFIYHFLIKLISKKANGK
jgi:VanZ family protein